jgi:hypothetical protein
MPHIPRRRFMMLGTAAALCPLPALSAADTRVATNASGIALDGYDTTAYWQAGAYWQADVPRTGNPVHAVMSQQVPWHFETAQAAAKFEGDPERYAPKFGGFCTRALSFGKIVNADPEVWRIHEERLYLFAQPVGGEKFDEGQDAMIAAAQQFWDSLA